MAPLASKLVFFTSSTAAALTLGSVAYLVEHPRAFAPRPALVIEREIVPPTRPSPPDPVVVPEPVELAPLVITGEKAPLIMPAGHRVAPARKPPPAVKPKDFVPCTDWRDMGPTNIDKGDGDGMRRVRTLC